MKLKQIFFLAFVIIIPSAFIIGGVVWAYRLDKLLHINYYEFPNNYIFHTDKLGQFGDFIGGVLGTLLTILATIYVYKTYISQKTELEEQRKLISQQQFETTFFNLLNTHRELKKDLKIVHHEEFTTESHEYIKNKKSEIYGTEVIEEVNSYLNYKYKEIVFNKGENKTYGIQDVLMNTQIKEYNKLPKKDDKINVDFLYLIVFKKYQNQISHYCRNVYQILKFIRQAEENNKSVSYITYANIFQSQLNVSEQMLLFYNFINFDDEKKGIFSTVNLVNHYRFLENIGIENILAYEHKKFYNFPLKGDI